MTDGAALPLALSDLVADAARPRPHRRHGHLRPRVRRRLRGGVGVLRARGRPARRRRRRRGGRRWARASWAPAPGSGFSGIEVGPVLDAVDRARRATRSRACGCRSPTSGRATRACRTTRSPRCASRAGAGSRSRCRRSAASTRRGIRADLEARRARRAPRPRRRRAGRHRRTASTAHGLRITSMGRPAAADPVLFEAAAAAGVLAARSDALPLASSDLMDDAPDRRERLLNLLAALLETRRGLHARRDRARTCRSGTRRSPSPPARRSSGTRRACGPWASRSSRSVRDNESRYRVDPKEYYLPDLGSATSELAALHVAVTAIGLGAGGGEGAGALDEARRARGHRRDARRRAARSSTRSRRCSTRPGAASVVEFEYRGRPATVEPWGLTSKFGHWYVVGHDLGVGEMRVFRADRIDGDIVATEPGAFTVPTDFRADAYLADQPWEYGAGRAIAGADPDRRRPRGRSSRARSAPDTPDRARAGRLRRRRALGRELRRSAQLRARLPRPRRGAVAPRSPRRGHRLARSRSRPGQCVSPRREAEGGSAAGAGDGAVARRHRGATKAEVAARFGITLEQLERDLGADHDGRRAAVLARRLHQHRLRGRHRRRLARAVLHPAAAAHRGRGPRAARRRAGRCSRCRARTSGDRSPPRSTSSRPRSACRRSSSTSRRPSTSRAVRDAAERGERIEIDYWSAGRDALDDPPDRPGPPFFALGEWYTDAFDHLRGEPRMFRVDRIRAVRTTDETFTPVPAGAPGAVYNPRPDDRRVTSSSRRRRAGSPRLPGRVGRGAGRRRPAGRARGERERVARAAAAPGRPRGPGGRAARERRDRPGAARRILTRYRGA